MGSWVLLEVGGRDCISLAPSPAGDLQFDSQDTCLPVQRPLSQATGAIVTTLVAVSLLKPLLASSQDSWRRLPRTVNTHSSITIYLRTYLYKVTAVYKTHHKNSSHMASETAPIDI